MVGLVPIFLCVEGWSAGGVEMLRRQQTEESCGALYTQTGYPTILTPPPPSFILTPPTQNLNQSLKYELWPLPSLHRTLRLGVWLPLHSVFLPSPQSHPFLQGTLMLSLVLKCLLAQPHCDLCHFWHLALGPNQFCCCWMIQNLPQSLLPATHWVKVKLWP